MLIGIDGGGTKTVCVVTDLRGQALGRAVAGPSNKVEIGTALESLRQALRNGLDSAGIGTEEVQGICAGLSGVERKENRQAFENLFRGMFPGCALLLESDALVALAGATEGRPGTILISGTGSVALGINQHGETARCGGWGHLFGDEGSGYDMVRQAVAACLHAEDGRGPATSLGEKFCRKLQVGSIAEVKFALENEDIAATDLASGFPVVLEAAQERDAVARQLFRTAGGQLAHMAATVARRLGLEGPQHPVCGTGGVWKSSGLLRRAFEAALHQQLPGSRVAEPLQPPEYGAALMARARLQGQSLFQQPASGRRPEQQP